MDKIEDLITLRNMYCKIILFSAVLNACVSSQDIYVKKVFRNKTRFNYKMKRY